MAPIASTASAGQPQLHGRPPQRHVHRVSPTTNPTPGSRPPSAAPSTTSGPPSGSPPPRLPVSLRHLPRRRRPDARSRPQQPPRHRLCLDLPADRRRHLRTAPRRSSPAASMAPSSKAPSSSTKGTLPRFITSPIDRIGGPRSVGGRANILTRRLWQTRATGLISKPTTESAPRRRRDQPVFDQRVYTVRHGLLRGLKRRGEPEFSAAVGRRSNRRIRLKPDSSRRSTSAEGSSTMSAAFGIAAECSLPHAPTTPSLLRAKSGKSRSSPKTTCA